MSESIAVVLGSPLPLSLTLPDGASGLFPQAVVYDSADAPVAGSPFDLTEVGATGRYTNAAFTPGAFGTFAALFIVYSNAGHTVEATTYARDQDSFTVTDYETETSAAARAVINQTEHDATQVAIAANLVAIGLSETEAAAAARAVTNQTEHDATQVLIAALGPFGLTAAEAARLLYLWTHASGDDTNKMTHIRATIGTPGSAKSDNNLVDQVVTQVDADTATFEQQ